MTTEQKCKVEIERAAIASEHGREAFFAALAWIAVRPAIIDVAVKASSAPAKPIDGWSQLVEEMNP